LCREAESRVDNSEIVAGLRSDFCLNLGALPSDFLTEPTNTFSCVRKCPKSCQIPQFSCMAHELRDKQVDE
jgi:hypothetical protein